MTALDIRAVCARHGITISVAPTADDREHWEAVILDPTEEQPLVVNGRECWFTSYDAADAAVCEVLQARWGISTHRYDEDVLCPWRAMSEKPYGTMRRHFGDTEFTVVVALADRLAKVQP